MKKILFSPLILLITIFSVSAQEFDKVEDYVAHIKKNHKLVYDDVTAYLLKLESGNMPVAEAQRRVFTKKAPDIIVSIHGMPSFKGDKTLQDSLAAYMRRTYWIMEKEYPKIQRMQDSATRSYSSALKFSQAKRTALNSLIKDESNFFEGLKAFSGKNGVAVPASYDNEYEKMLYVKDVASHHTTLELIVDKCKAEETILAKAVQAKSKEGMEEHAAILEKYVKEGYALLDTVKPYKQDRSLLDAARSTLAFYQSESEFKVPILLHLLAEGNVRQAPTADTDGVATYPNTQKDLDLDRAAAWDRWTKASAAFIKKYLPQ